MMDDDWPFGARGVMKGVFWAIGFLKLFFLHIFCMCVFYVTFCQKTTQKKPLLVLKTTKTFA
jgi:hypothetical protein